MIEKQTKFLYIIPARGGSKGIPKKNIKLLNGKPLIYYSIDIARDLVSDEDICVSTDSDEIIEVVNKYSLSVPFVRPSVLATDTATTNDVLLHALSYYEKQDIFYDVIILLQPTSPFRTVQNIKKAIGLYSSNLDMVVSVKKSTSSAVICEENSNGYLEMTLNKNNARRQDAKNYYEYNGSIYVINTKSLKEKGLANFEKIKKVVMNEIQSIDIDTLFEWRLAEFILKEKIFIHD